jgi:hypothetical protein
VKNFLSQVRAFLSIPPKNVKRNGYTCKEKLNVYEKALHEAIANYKKKHFEKDPTQEYLAVTCNIGVSTVRRYSKTLEEKGCIARERCVVRGYYSEYHYTILKTAARHDWEASGNANSDEIKPDKNVPRLRGNALILKNKLYNNHHKGKNEIKSKIDEKPVAAFWRRSGFWKKLDKDGQELVKKFEPNPRKYEIASEHILNLLGRGFRITSISAMLASVTAVGMVPFGSKLPSPCLYPISYLANHHDRVHERMVRLEKEALAREGEMKAKFKLAKTEAVDEILGEVDENDPPADFSKLREYARLPEDKYHFASQCSKHKTARTASFVLNDPGKEREINAAGNTFNRFSEDGLCPVDAR